MEERSSKAIVTDYYTSFGGMKEYKAPPNAYKVLMDMVEADPLLFNAVSLTADLVTYNGFTFTGDNERLIKQANKMFLEELDFDQVIDNVLWSLIVYGDAYLEVRWNQDKTKVMELHPLDTQDMEIKYNDKGDILGYRQKVKGKGEEFFPSFATDEIIYFRQYWVGTQVYSRAPFKSIGRDFATNVYANNYLQSIFVNLPPKLIYFLKNASESQRKIFIENLYRAKTNPQMDVIAQGEAFDSKLLQVAFDAGLINVLEFLQKRVLSVTRVPPHWVGIMDGANRGIGENVVIPYETKIKKLQAKIASQINKELLPKLKLSNLEFKWNAISLIDEKTIVEIMNFLKAQQFDDETLIQFGRDHGLRLREGASIKEIEMPTGQTLQNETAQSRMRNNPKSDKMNSNIDKKGVSAEGKEKLDEKKVV